MLQHYTDGQKRGRDPVLRPVCWTVTIKKWWEKKSLSRNLSFVFDIRRESLQEERFTKILVSSSIIATAAGFFRNVNGAMKGWHHSAFRRRIVRSAWRDKCDTVSGGNDEKTLHFRHGALKPFRLAKIGRDVARKPACNSAGNRLHGGNIRLKWAGIRKTWHG